MVQVKKADEEKSRGFPARGGGDMGLGGEGWGMSVSLYGEIRCIVGNDHSVAGGKYILYKTKPHKF